MRDVSNIIIMNFILVGKWIVILTVFLLNSAASRISKTQRFPAYSSLSVVEQGNNIPRKIWLDNYSKVHLENSLKNNQIQSKYWQKGSTHNKWTCSEYPPGDSATYLLTLFRIIYIYNIHLTNIFEKFKLEIIHIFGNDI